MEKYDIELSGSQTVYKKANTLSGVWKAARYAMGKISITFRDKEIFFGNVTELNYWISDMKERGHK
jgi:hypothetical protein